MCDFSKVYGSITHSIWIARISRRNVLKVSIRKNLNSMLVVKDNHKSSSYKIISPEDKLCNFAPFFFEAFDVKHFWRWTSNLVRKVTSLWSVDLPVLAKLCWVGHVFSENRLCENYMLAGAVIDWLGKDRIPKLEWTPVGVNWKVLI